MVIVSLYYDGTNPNGWTQDLTETLLLPRHSNVRLLKAVVPHGKGVNITAVDALDLYVNDDNADPIIINLPSTGNKTIQEVVSELNAAAATAIAAEGVTNCEFLARYDSTKGHGPGAFVFDVKLTSKFYNIIRTIDFSTAPWNGANFVESEINTNRLDSATYQSTNTALGVIDIQASGGGGAVSSWANAFVLGTDNETAPGYLDTWFKGTTDSTLAQPPDPRDDFGALAWTVQHGGLNDGGGAQSFWMGLTANTTTTLVGGITTNASLAEITNINEACVVCFLSGETSGTFVKGTLYVYERLEDGSLGETHEYAGVDNGDELGITFHSGEPCIIWRRADGQTAWQRILPNQGAQRGLVDIAPIYACGGFYDAAVGTNQADLQIDNIGGSFAQGLRVAEYGEYIQIDLDSDFANTIGFNDDTRTVDGPELIWGNDQDISIVEASEDCPAVNVIIRNLPIRSWCNNNTIRTGLSTQGVIGCLSRYDESGQLSASNALAQYYPVSSGVEIRNAEELPITQLTIEYRDVDGKVPTDLSSPQWLMLEFSSAK